MRPGRTVFLLLLAALAFIWLVPILQLALSSLKTLPELRGSHWTLPQSFNLDAYAEAWRDARISQHLWNSVLIVGCAVPLSMAVSSLCAFALARLRLPGGRLLSQIFLAGLVVPAQIALIPLYHMLDDLGLLSSYLGIILVHTSWALPFGIFVMTSFFREVPWEIQEAAQIDGCGNWGIYWRIMLPLSLPALASLAIFLTVWVWNDFLFGLILVQSMQMKPVTVGVANLQGQYMTVENTQSAAGLLASLVPLTIFLAFQRFYVRGLSAGATKG